MKLRTINLPDEKDFEEMAVAIKKHDFENPYDTFFKQEPFSKAIMIKNTSSEDALLTKKENIFHTLLNLVRKTGITSGEEVGRLTDKSKIMFLFNGLKDMLDILEAEILND